ncbi:MAG: energy-coupling factor transporter ATPase, partial [Oscillospiraceae bacterium]
VLVMSEGEIVMQGTPKEVFAQVDKIKELRLDVPPATELCLELKQAGVDIAQDILSTEECASALYELLKDKTGAKN